MSSCSGCATDAYIRWMRANPIPSLASTSTLYILTQTVYWFGSRESSGLKTQGQSQVAMQTEKGVYPHNLHIRALHGSAELVITIYGGKNKINDIYNLMYKSSTTSHPQQSLSNAWRLRSTDDVWPVFISGSGTSLDYNVFTIQPSEKSQAHKDTDI